MKKARPCKHPPSAIQPGVFHTISGSFMTLGPRKREERHVVDWCEDCGAIRIREHNNDPWGAWMPPKGAGR